MFIEVDLVQIANSIIWGNHSSTQFPDWSHATVNGGDDQIFNPSKTLDSPFDQVVLYCSSVSHDSPQKLKHVVLKEYDAYQILSA